MGEVIISLIKYIGISAFLWSIYTLLFKGKSSFTAQRIYLLLIPIISIIGAIFSLPVILVDQNNSVGKILSSADAISESITTNSEFIILSQAEKLSDNNSNIFNFDLLTIVVAIAIFLSLTILVRYVKGIRKISSIRKLSTISRQNNISICRSGLVETPFSFMFSIFIDRKIDGEKLDMVLTHEMTHINRYHQIDKIISRIYIILSWFNPFVWSIQREIEAVHEFEADYSVLNSKFDVKRYKQYLFDELTLTSPYMSSGFNNSLIKQRFIQMKNNYKIKNRLLRRALTLPAVVIILALTSFTYINEEALVTTSNKTIETLNDKLNNISPQSTIIEDNVKVKEEQTLPIEEATVEQFKKIISEFEPAKKESVEQTIMDKIESYRDHLIATANVLKESAEIASSKLDEIKKSSDNIVKKDKYNYYDLDRSQYTVNSKRVRDIVRVYRYDDHTEVDYCTHIVYSSQWVSVSKNTFLVDTQSNDKYKIHSIKNNVPIDRNLRINDQKGKYITMTLIFPPLSKNIRYIDLIEEDSDTLTPPSNNTGNWKYHKIKVEKKRDEPIKENIITLDPNFKTR